MTIKKKIAIYILGVSIITSLIIYFVILPTLRDIKKINEAVYAEKIDLEKKYLRGQLLKKTIEDFEKIKPEKDKLKSLFITEGEELTFITALEKVAASHNLNQKLSLQPLKDNEEGNNLYYSLPLTITIQGKFIDTLKYLEDLEKLNYYFNILSITISTNLKGQEDLVMVKLEGKIYGLSTKKEAI